MKKVYLKRKNAGPDVLTKMNSKLVLLNCTMTEKEDPILHGNMISLALLPANGSGSIKTPALSRKKTTVQNRRRSS